MSDLVDLFQFLDSPNPSARHLALQNLVGHTAKSDPDRHIFLPSSLGHHSTGLIPQKRSIDSDGDNVKIKAIKDLTSLCRDQAFIAHDALSALINLSDTLAAAQHMVDQEFLVWLVSYTANTTSTLSPLTSMLLSNLTSLPTLLPAIASLQIPISRLPKSSHYPPYYFPASASISSTIHPDYWGPSIGRLNELVGQEEETDIEAVRALAEAFADGASVDVKEGRGKRKGECHFLASVFANISMAPTTRSLLLVPRPPFPNPSTSAPSDVDEPLLAKIVVYTEHSDTIRRGGALGCIKNCAMDRGSHAWLLTSENDRVKLPSDPSRMVRGVDVLPWVLSPLMGAEEYDMEEMEQLPLTLQFLPDTKVREKDIVLRMMCVEILLLLATKLAFTGRQSLRSRGGYFVVREAHKVETDPQIKEAIERLVSLLQGEESRETRVEEVSELVKVSSVHGGRQSEEDEDDELGVIEV